MSAPVRIPVAGGLFALVDAEDAARVLAFRWHTKRQTAYPTKVYVQRSTRLTPGRKGKRGSVALHRFILDAPPGAVVDHRNGDPFDNRRENLRLCTAEQNSRNVTSSKNRKAGAFKGVSWNRRAQKWEAAIGAGERKANGKARRLYLGVFERAADAARAYDAAALRYFGEFAALNFPLERGQAQNDAARAVEGGRRG